MLPPEWQVRLVDENIEQLTDTDLDWADIVLTGGTMPQQQQSLNIIDRARERGKTVLVGGPDASSSPHLYSRASHLILDEAELTLPVFLEDFRNGQPKPLYRDAGKADVRKTPPPRFDLLKFDKYTYVGVQWCRGCPFNCEFCDIIELFGRVPRAKDPDQMLRELQLLYDLGYRGHVNIVDDNFIGNKKLVKQFLPILKKWLEERGWPFEFTTEATINLADDKALMQMMKECGFFSVFIGIESPDDQTLARMQKLQNTRRSISQDIHKIYAHGMIVSAGFILGCDEEKGSVARGIIECVQEAAIPISMPGLLFALPLAQLTRRLANEGRLFKDFDVLREGDGQFTAGLNFVTARPRIQILEDHLRVVETIYTADNYFDRVLRAGLMLNSSARPFRPNWRRNLKELKGLGRLILKLGLPVATRRLFWRVVMQALWKNPRSLRYTVSLLALYLHFGPFAEYVGSKSREAINQEGMRESVTAEQTGQVMSGKLGQF
jgi:hypothetical protein